MSADPGSPRRLTPTEARVLGAVDHDGLLSLLRVLVAVPSLDGQESPAQRAVATWLAEQGLATDVWPIDLVALARHPQYSAEVERDEALGVVGWIGESAPRGGGRDLLLNGHIDVVPPGDERAWTTPPWDAAVRDGRVYGRGAVDMKGGLCCALVAAKAVRDAGVRLRGRLSVASVVGEEDGGTGTLATLLRGHRADGAVVVEPTALHVVPAQAGSLMFRLVVPGHAAHGCVREEGVSAVEKFLPLFAALRRLEAERCGVSRGRAKVAGRPDDPLFARYRLPWPIEVGTVRAGDWASSVPGTLVAEGRCGVAVGEDPGAARAAVEDAIARAAAQDGWLRDHPPAVEWWGGRFDPAVTDASDPIVTTVARAAEVITGRTPPVEGVTYGADLRLLVNVGRIPTVLFGPGDVRVAHMPDEYVPLADLRAATETLVLTALRYCGVKEQAARPAGSGDATRDLPKSYVLRHPTAADLPAAQAVLDAAESHDTSEARRHEDRLATEWAAPRCDLGHDWWVVEAPGAGVVAVGWVWPTTAGEVTADHYVHPAHRGHGLGDVLLDAIERRSAELSAQLSGAASRHLVVWSEDSDISRRVSLEQRGFVATRQYFEMAIALDDSLAEAAWPEGVSSRSFRLGIDEGAVHQVDTEAFAEHFLFEARSLDEWQVRHLEPADADPTLWRLAWDGDRLVGFVIAADRDEGAFIEDLAVLKPWRGRGIGRALLATVFAELRDRGQAVARLYVDAQNVTDAVRVYEAAGMHVARRFDVMQKILAREEGGPGP